MGPLVYTSGNLERAAPPTGGPRAFNGAAGLHQRKLYVATLDPEDDWTLQWGRWFTPAETIDAPTWAYVLGHLQWGRWFTPAETWECG